MKTLFLYTLAALLAIAGCERPEQKNNAEGTPVELQQRLDKDQKAELIRQWQSFRTFASEGLIKTNEKLAKLEAKQGSATRKKLREFRYEHNKLYDKLLRRSLKFTTRIEHYTEADRIKNEAFRTSFKARLEKLDSDLDAALEKERSKP